MKPKVLMLSIMNIFLMLSSSQGQLALSKKEIKLLYANDIERFVRMAGSEEDAIAKLMGFNLADTLYKEHAYKNMIWQIKSPQKLIEEDYYSSRKMQSFYWILKIYTSSYTSNKNKDEICVFTTNTGEIIWDYEDLNVEEKAYFYQVIIASPVDPKSYYDSLGYKKVKNKSYQELERAFINWYKKMKIHGLEYMRKNNLPPLNSSKYEIRSK